ncbi:hypothetical protein M408DRAFT_331749 [Serendipita vermifera MAFF 305830]|uniref:Protein kinase domain-containing protein n=1 Tax=Serendipita vermifera MAFF 305830 TaxID=933852 RepID=A0A0C3AZ47_SERVB|nr:hypothetical protein M408DRAFT_331749 [Serendipita vermifera MAFF 305830]
MEKYHTTLAARLEVAQSQGQQGIPVDDLKPLVKELLLLLSEFHDKNHAHLDIKPWNILVAPNGRLALCDVSSSHFHDPKNNITKHIPKRGSLGFLAIEILERRPVADARPADMYSLGATIAWLRGVQISPAPLDADEIIGDIDLAFHPETYSFANDFLRKLLLLPNEERPSANEALADPWLVGCDVEPRDISWLKYVVPSRDRVTFPHPGPIKPWPHT